MGGKFKEKVTGGNTSIELEFPAFGASSPNGYMDIDDSGNISIDGIRGGLKRFDFGLTFGTGVEIKKLYIGMEYNLGLIDIAGEQHQIGFTPYKFKNRNFAISIGYNFR